MKTTISNTSNEILGVSPSELVGYTRDEIAGFIRNVQDGLAASEPRMSEDEISTAADQIFTDATISKSAAALGKLGGSKNTPAQNRARAINGRKGGRPRKS